MDSSHLPGGLGPHAAFIKTKMPDWIAHSVVADIQRLRPGIFPGHAPLDQPPPWFAGAPSWLRQALINSQVRSRQANETLARTLKDLQNITQFAEPRLTAALHSHAGPGRALDIHNDRLFYLRRHQPIQQQSLLQAALLNFEGNEDFSALVDGQASALAPQGALAVEAYVRHDDPADLGTLADSLVHGSGSLVGRLNEERVNLRPAKGFRYREKLAMSPQVFSQICRSLDLGQQYQDHLHAVFDAPDKAPIVRYRMIRAHKELLAVRMHGALMQNHISLQAHDMLSALLGGHPAPRLAGKPVVFSQLGLYGFTLAGVLIIGPYRSWLPVLEWERTGLAGVPLVKQSDRERLVVYIPGAPKYPLKEYPSLEAFQYDLGLNLRTPAYQQLLAGLVPQGSARAFMSRLNAHLYQKNPDPKGVEPAVYVDEVDLRLSVERLDIPAPQLFARLNDLHLQRLKANARVLAVPTADADSRLLQERLDYYLGLGLDALNVAAFFIPGAGEVMMAVMALQMGMEVYHGIESWSVGDVEGAWAHLESVAVNLALAGVMEGAGRGIGKIPSGTLQKWVDTLTQIVLPNGETRLWRPDLAPYRCEAAFRPGGEPNALGQYEVDGRLYVQVDQYFYEQTFDQALASWRIKDPRDEQAYRPILKHNHAGAWRHSHEQPLQWSRTTLLRRLGHETRMFSDEVLGQIGEVSGVSDEALRKVHMDGLPVPALLMDTLEQFRVERELEALIVDIGAGAGFNRQYADVLRILVEMPGWPEGQEIQLVQGGQARNFGHPVAGNDARPMIRLSADDMAQGHLARQVVNSLGEDECLALLGPGRERRDAFNQRLARAVSGRRHALVNRLGAMAAPEVAALRRRFPGLSERGAQEVLGLASAADVTRLRMTGRGSRGLDDLARAYVQQGRLNRALAGLYVPGLATLDSERLAIEASLHLGRVPAGAQGDWLGDVARYATTHRRQMARTLNLRTPGARPTLQHVNGRPGYPLSGRGAAYELNPSLVSRVRDIYPNITDEEAGRYLGKRISQGETDQQIFSALAILQRELDTLRNTLEQWAGATREPFIQRMRRLASDRLIGCWREGVYREGEPGARLNLNFDLGWFSGLPPLDADFSHVKTLKLGGELMLSEPDLGLVRRFSGVRRLELSLEQQDMPGVAAALVRLPAVTELALEADWQGFPQLFLDQLKAVGQIERLSLSGSMPTLDVSGWPRLRELRVSGALEHWPEGVFGLEHLQALDLFGTTIKTVPERLFTSPQGLWQGLLLDWSGIEPRTALKAWEYLRAKRIPALDADKWAAAYCTGCLTRFTPQDGQLANSVMAHLVMRKGSLPELVARVNGLHVEYRVLIDGIDAWCKQGAATVHNLFRSQVAEKLQRCWSLGVARRLGAEDVRAGPSWRLAPSIAELDLSGGVLGDLPVLPGDEAFAHVQRLNMSELGVPVQTLERFLASFGHVRELDLSRNGLTSLPEALGDLRQLTALNLGHNALNVTPVLQGRLDRLSRLETLDLRGNRVTALDVRAMPGLESLDLSLTGIRQWPTGALELPRLGHLDMSRSAIRIVPLAALNGHDQLLQGTLLNGCQLSQQSCADLLGYAQRTGKDKAGNIPTALLAIGKTGGTPEFFPEEVNDNPDLLLPAAPALPPAEVVVSPDPVFAPDGPSSTRSALLQRVNPDLTLREAIDFIEQLQQQGMGVLAIDARLAQWNREHDVLIQRLNGWINAPSHREGGRWVSAADRRQAADRIMQAWRKALKPVVQGEAGSLDTLDFSDLCLGDIPALTVQQPHIDTLDLNGVRVTAEGAGAFICEFPNLRTLRLNNNELTRLPEGLGSLPRLTRLEASYNHLETASGAVRQVQALARLEWLDLSYNRLESFDLTGLDHLQTLNLQGNNLVRWPTRVLNTPTLRSLDLSHNQIDYIPTELFEGDNDRLMAHTDLSDNVLSASGYSTLRDYMEFSGNDLGCSREEIENGLAYDELASSSDDESDTDSANTDENLDRLDHLSAEQLAEQKARWFEGVAPGSPKHATWEQLRSHPQSKGLFYLLDQLQFTRDYLQDRAGLTQRVWDVLQAAQSDSLLRDELFIIGHSDVTCGDGRILLFSDLEVKVYEFNALRSVVPGREGQVLLRLARRLFRLGQVEDIAELAYRSQQGGDAAEVRLAYRISLTKRLDLPAQPRDMQYRRAARVTAQDIERAYEQVKAAEQSPLFLQQLIAQDYWVNYLKRQYPDDFRALELRFEDRHKALEDRHVDLGDDYQRDIHELDDQKKTEVQQLRERLTAREIASIEP